MSTRELLLNETKKIDFNVLTNKELDQILTIYANNIKVRKAAMKILSI